MITANEPATDSTEPNQNHDDTDNVRKRKVAKTFTVPLAGLPPANSSLPKANVTYASAIAAGASSANPATTAAPSSSSAESPSLCLQAMLMGVKMLRIAANNNAASPSETTTALPALGVLVKSVHYNKKQWRHYALFGSTEIEIVAAPNSSYPENLNPSLHPCRIVCIRSDLLNPKTPINASFLHVVTAGDVQKLKDLRILSAFLPGGFGKIQYEPTGMHVKVMGSTYKSGPDDKHTYLRPIYNHLGKKHILIPVSALHFSEAKDSPRLEQSVLPTGTHVNFKFGINPTTGNSFACNLQLITILPADNCYGSPPQKMESIVQMQPGGFKVDVHAAPFAISLRSERCDQLSNHIKTKIPSDSIALYIIHSNATMQDPFYASVGELDRHFLVSPHKCSWDRANLDQIVEMILHIKNNDRLNEHKKQKKHFTVVFTLANQNQQNIVTKTIAESYNTHKHAGHLLLHADVGVLLVLQPTSHSNKGIVAQINAAQILSKAHCSSLHSTHTYPPGYSIPYVKDTGKVHLGETEQILGSTHTYISLLIFADSAKLNRLHECLIAIGDDDVIPITSSNGVIPIQWQPGSIKDTPPRHSILDLLNDADFLLQAEVSRPNNHDRKKKFEDVIRTAYIKPKPGFEKSVLATLLLHKDILTLPNNSLDDEGFLVRSSRPYPVDAFDLVKHSAVKYAQFLSPFALRVIYADGHKNEAIPELLKLDKTIAHIADNLSLVPAAGSPWNEVIADGVHSTLGRTLAPPTALCPYSIYIGGFTGFPTTSYLQDTLFRTIFDAPLLIVDSPEETKDGGVFVQFLKSSIRPTTLHAKDVTVSILSRNDCTRNAMAELVKVVEHFSKGSLYPVTDGLQFLSVQATAVSTAKGSTMGEEALNLFKAKFQSSFNAFEDLQDWNEQGHHPHAAAVADEQREESQSQWNVNEASNRRSGRNRTKSGNTYTQQPKPTKTTTSNNLQAQTKKGNQFLALDDDIDLFDDPDVVTAATQSSSRKADAGDFDTTKDTKITSYLMEKWLGYRPEDQTKSVAKLLVTIWARLHPEYHIKQLGTNFTGLKKMGGLISAFGRSDFSLKPIVALLKDNVRNQGDLEDLYRKIGEHHKTAQEQASKNTQQHPQPQPTTQAPATSTNRKSSNQQSTSKVNNTPTSNTSNKGIISSYFNPLSNANNVDFDLTNSQENKNNTQEETESMLDETPPDNTSSGHDSLAGMTLSTPVAPPVSPSKVLPSLSSSPIGFASSAAVSLSFLGGMPATNILTSPDLAASNGGTNN